MARTARIRRETGETQDELALDLDGSEVFSITRLSDTIKPGETITLRIEDKNRKKRAVPLKLRIDTPIEIDYYRHGGILPFVLRQLLAK